MEEIKLLFSGDFGFHGLNLSGPIPNISDNLRRRFKSCDSLIVDLEGPILDSFEIPMSFKTGPHIFTNSDVMNTVIEDIGNLSFCLANNHIMDYGLEGLRKTLNFCRARGIKTLGAGENKTSVEEPLRFHKGGISISVLNFAEDEWNVSEKDLPGVNGLDIVNNVRQIEREKFVSDYVIVVIHGGNEYYNLPNFRIRDQYRFYIENGADLIVCHHTHTISGMEEWMGKGIYYGLGNFLLTLPSANPDWYEGLLLEVVINKFGISTDLVPIHQDLKVFSVDEILDTQHRLNLINRFNKLSGVIINDKLLESSWEKFVESRKLDYIMSYSYLKLFDINFLKKIFYKLGLFKYFLRRRDIATNLNYVKCQSHCDLLIASLEKSIRK